MLIYAVADIHGDQKKLDMISDMIARHKPDVLVIAGDMSHHFKPQPVEMLKIFNSLGVPVLAITGNSDNKHVLSMLENTPGIHHLHLKQARINGVLFAGAGGTFPVPFRSRMALREKQLVEKLGALIEPGSVLVVHPPPYGVVDRVLGRFHAGSKSVKKIIEQRSPALCVCGHIHEGAGSVLMGKTLVVNCAMNKNRAGALIFFEQGNTLMAEMI